MRKTPYDYWAEGYWITFVMFLWVTLLAAGCIGGYFLVEWAR